jgi:hypothetical protein
MTGGVPARQSRAGPTTRMDRRPVTPLASLLNQLLVIPG